MNFELLKTKAIHAFKTSETTYSAKLIQFYNPKPVAYPGILFGGVQQIQLRTEDRENGYLGVVAPSQGFWRQL